MAEKADSRRAPMLYATRISGKRQAMLTVGRRGENFSFPSISAHFRSFGVSENFTSVPLGSIWFHFAARPADWVLGPAARMTATPFGRHTTTCREIRRYALNRKCCVTCRPVGGHQAAPSNGLCSSTCNWTKSVTFLVTTVSLLTMAVAAIMASSDSVSDRACMSRAHSRKA